MMDHRSPLDNIFSIISGLPQGHDKPVKHAFYNALAIFLLVLCCAAGWALFIILGPFIKPLIWALLVGSVLHPIKHNLSYHFRCWLESLEQSRTPVMIGLLLLPTNIIYQVSELIGSTLSKYLKCILGVVFTTAAMHTVYYYTPRFVTCLIWKFTYYMNGLIMFMVDNCNNTLIVLIFILYATVMVLLWKPENNDKFHVASTFMWLLFSCFIAHQCQPFQIPVFVLLTVVLAAGFIFEVLDLQEELSRVAGKPASLMEAVKYAFAERETKVEHKEKEDTEKSSGNDKCADKEAVADKTGKSCGSQRKEVPDCAQIAKEKMEQTKRCSSLNNTSFIITDQGNIHVLPPTETREGRREFPKFKRAYSQSQIGLPLLKSRASILGFRKACQSPGGDSSNVESQEYASDFYIYSLLWACAFMVFWKHTVLLPVLPIPILIYTLKHLGHYTGFWQLIDSYWCRGRFWCKSWCQDRYDALIPLPIRGLFRITGKVNSALKRGIKDSIDTVASCVVIFGLIIVVLCGSIFIAMQIYTEGILLVQMTSNLINQTVVHNPELRQLLPPTFDETVDSVLDNAYQYGREGISRVIRSMMNDVDSTKSENLERQVLELWDRVYQKWMSAESHMGPNVNSRAVEHSWDAFINDLQKSTEVFNISGIMEFLKQNVGTLMSLLDSVWSILKGNINLVLGSFSAFISILLGGGTAVFNFFLNLIIFFTTLFYLLSSSGDLYKPVELMTKFSPSGSRLGLALGAAINSVFTASLKMAVFYGMWTWFIHNLFEVRIVYIPSVMAAIFGAAPFLGTYWACLPAVFDLWLGQERGFFAILMAVFQIVPTYILDATIYSEIQGGHPYLTGLAIAGGIFCLGLEGAIVGPLLLCGLYVAMDLSSSLFKDSPSEESLNLPALSRLQIVDIKEACTH